MNAQLREDLRGSLAVYVRAIVVLTLIFVTDSETAFAQIGLYPDVAHPTVVATYGGRLEVFVRGMNNHLVQRSWNGSQWGGWKNLGGDLTAAPSITSSRSGRLDVFVRGMNGPYYPKTGSRDLDCRDSLIKIGWSHDRYIPSISFPPRRSCGLAQPAPTGCHRLFVNREPNLEHAAQGPSPSTYRRPTSPTRCTSQKARPSLSRGDCDLGNTGHAVAMASYAGSPEMDLSS